MRAWHFVVGGIAAGLAAYVATRSVQRGSLAGGIEEIGKDIVSATDKLRSLIEFEEGLRLTVYQDPGAGAWTIGYGHLVKPGEPYHPYGPVQTITKEEAEQLLASDTADARSAVDRLVRVPLSENQYAALVSFVYNIGETQFRNSTLLRVLNNGDYDAAAAELERWVLDNGKVVQILVGRRAREKDLFLTA